MAFYLHMFQKGAYRLAYANDKHSVTDIECIDAVDVLAYKLVIESSADVPVQKDTVVRAIKVCNASSTLEVIEFCGDKALSNELHDYVDIVNEISSVERVRISGNFLTDDALVLLAMYGKQGKHKHFEMVKCTYEFLTMQSFLYFAGHGGMRSLKLKNCDIDCRSFIGMHDRCIFLKVLHIIDANQVMSEWSLKHIEKMRNLKELVINKDDSMTIAFREYRRKCPDVRLMFVDADGTFYHYSGKKVKPSAFGNFDIAGTYIDGASDYESEGESTIEVDVGLEFKRVRRGSRALNDVYTD